MRKGRVHGVRGARGTSCGECEAREWCGAKQEPVSHIAAGRRLALVADVQKTCNKQCARARTCC
eukprot:2366011-Prymnesium_polylepis.1